jgi:hypothetical protein
MEQRLLNLLDRLEPTVAWLRAGAQAHGLRFDFYCGCFMQQSSSG